jgi:hypothetical protein
MARSPFQTFLPFLLLALAACTRSASQDASPVDCQEDFDCFVARARTCAPASVLRREQFDILGGAVRVVSRHEVVGRVRGRCHVRRTRIEPPPPPIHERKDPFAPDAQPPEEPSPEEKALDVRGPPRSQCLFSDSQTAEAMQRLAQGRSTPEDLESCYPGDGRCGPAPLLAFHCALGGCLLGRWTYSCEPLDGRNIYACEGTRRSDASPPDAGCASWCEADGREQLDCREPRATDGGTPK